MSIIQSKCSVHISMAVEKCADDIYNDMKYSQDLRETLKDIWNILGVKYLALLERVPHRWLSAYDVSVRVKEMLDLLKLFYYAWGDCSAYRSEFQDIVKKYNVNQEAKDKLKEKVAFLKKKNLTEQGRQRKKRIVEELYYKATNTIMVPELYCYLSSSLSCSYLSKR